MIMNRILVIVSMIWASLSASAQSMGFVFNGQINMPDGTEVSLICQTDTAQSVEVSKTIVRRGKFRLTGHIDRPRAGVLTTNNMALVDRHHWPTDSIRWTYTDVYVFNDVYTVSPSFEVKGGSVQSDFIDLQRMGGAQGDSVWTFIDRHPASPVSVWLASQLLRRAYRLTAEQVEHLASTIQPNTLDSEGYRQFTVQLASARHTAIGFPLVSIDLERADGSPTRLTEVVPINGKYTLLDFWASWCGICLHSIPDVKALAEHYADRLNVVGISIDTKADAWQKSMTRHPASWPQYRTTPSGYRDLIDKLQVGNGVPYYLLVSPDGKVVGAPEGPADAERMLLSAQSQYRITGKVDSTQDGDTIYICSMQGFFSMIPEDSAIVRNGGFDFSGRVEGAHLRYLLGMHAGRPVSMAPFILEPGITRIEAYSDNGKTVVEGGESQRLWDNFQREEAVINEAMSAPWEITRDSLAPAPERAAAHARLDSLDSKLKAFHKQFIVDHVPSALSDMLFAFYQSEMSPATQDSILAIFGQRQPQYPVYKAIMNERAAQKATAVGQPYTDLTLNAPDGRTLRVSDYVTANRYTLVDFWASWCGPCRAEMPNVVKAYAKYHKRGFEVVGVSLDNNKMAWLKAIDQLNMPWPQMSDLKGWESAAAAAYNVKAIPSNVLIDHSGNIIAKDLRENALQEFLVKLFD